MSELTALLAKAPLRRLEATLVRAVAAAALFSMRSPEGPDFLFTSGERNRFNLTGTRCLYFSETESVALKEYQNQFRAAFMALQPVTLFYAQVRLKFVLDLTEETTLKELRISKQDLKMNWVDTLSATTSQRLGEAVAARKKIVAIRYDSVATSSGCNLVIFPANLNSMDFVRILGPSRKPLQKWP